MRRMCTDADGDTPNEFETVDWYYSKHSVHVDPMWINSWYSWYILVKYVSAILLFKSGV